MTEHYLQAQVIRSWCKFTIGTCIPDVEEHIAVFVNVLLDRKGNCFERARDRVRSAQEKVYNEMVSLHPSFISVRDT